ncbi:DUF2244 domain-containing protein [Oceaniglobus trochenteri]|uniref:DUF2244 domain-containing protein n=1 Tax=Oceaniglobus trochenteri TaxID=2763260 RepID=UPI001CFF5672|nr:DUF2244 domain-containing protein [Oceaniglobus trochenteri]
MPVRWEKKWQEAPVDPGAFLHGAASGPLARAVLWPNRSLPRRGMVGVIGFAFVMLLIPVFPLLGSPVLWGLLPFTMGAIWLLWFLLERSYASGAVREDLSIWNDRIDIVRSARHGPEKRWSANPFWVRLALRETGGPVANYLTLNGAGREVELGAFLSPEEREALHGDLQRLLNRLER